MLKTFWVIGFLFFFSADVAAQTTSAITGTVKDQTGAVIVGAKVTARNLETNLTRVTVTDAEGRYTFAELRVGRYELRAEQSGFKTSVHADFALPIGEALTLNFDLQPASVEVSADVTEAAQVNTTTSELSYLVGERAIRELPLNGRNYTDLALLQPGVTSFPQRDGGSVVAHGLGMTVNGQDIRSNVYLLDGTLLNDATNGPAGSAAGTVLGTESIREFRVESNSYSAEFGRNFGGQINAISKSGANQFHGSLYEFLRNDNLDARNFFDRQPLGKPEFKRNQFGGSVGGPIKKDRTFFFGNYEALRERLGRTILSFVPDFKARQGIVTTRDNSGNIVDTNVGVNAAVRPYLDAIPLPNGASLNNGVGNLAEYFFGFRQRLDEDFFQARVDHNLNDKNLLFVRHTFDDGDNFLPTDFPQFPRTFLSRNQFTTIEHTWLRTAYTVNKALFSFRRTRIGQDVAADVSLPPFITGRATIGDIDIGGMQRFGPQSTANFRLAQNVFSFSEKLVHVRGKHVLNFGGLVERFQINMLNPTFSLGIYTFPDVSSFLRNAPSNFVGLTPEAQFDRYWRITLVGMYAQDNYKVNQRLSLNLGLRYEFETVPQDRRDVFMRNLYSDSQLTLGPLYQNPSYKNISPRVGFAWDVFGNEKTALRGGYGIYFNTNNHQNLIVTVTNPPATPRPVLPNPSFPNPPFNRPGVVPAIRPVEYDIKEPYLNVYNLNLQQQLPWDTVVTVGYAGSRGVHLLRNTDFNIGVPTRQADGTWFFPNNAPRVNPNYNGVIELKKSDGNSWYNALIFEVRKRFSKGVDFQSSYTFSRSIDTTQASTFFSDATNATVSALPELPGSNYNKGLSDFHAKHNWVVNFNWEIPFAKGLTGAAGKILDGWSLLGIAQMRSGQPLTVFVQNNRSQSKWNPSNSPLLGRDRPSLAPGYTYESAMLGRPDQWLDPKAFVLQASGTLGNTGRNAFIGPNLRTFDLAATKTTSWAKLGERTRIQFRVEAFNLLNRANFGTPVLQVFAGSPLSNNSPLPDSAGQPATISTFGLIRSTVTTARQIQVGLRISF
jgi:hypothetical protein